MPIARRHAPQLRRKPAVALSLLATLALPAVPAEAAPMNSCAVGDFTARTQAGLTAYAQGDFTAQAQADLAKITVLDPGPLTRGLPALADLRLASAKGTVDSAARPYKSVASGRHADAELLGLPAGGAGAHHAAPGRRGPVDRELVTFRAAGLATASAGKSTAQAVWDDAYQCGKTGPLTRAATMLGGLSVLDGSGRGPAMLAGARRTSLLKVGPIGSTQSATDLIPIGGGRIGVRSGAGVALGDLALFAGTPQEISVKVVSQPTLEVISGGDRAHSQVTYRPAVLRVTAAGKPAHVLKDSGAAVSLALLGDIEQGRPAEQQGRPAEQQGRPAEQQGRPAEQQGRHAAQSGRHAAQSGRHAAQSGRHAAQSDRDAGQPGRPVALDVRLSLGEAEESWNGRQVRAEAATLRVEVKLGRAHLLDVALGHLSVAACAPAQVKSNRPSPRPRTGDETADPIPVDVTPPGTNSPSPSTSPSASVTPSESPAAVPSPGPSGGGTGGGALALTGSDVTVAGFAGAGLVMAGLISMLLTRRRRPTAN